jgi:hypothetical protein
MLEADLIAERIVIQNYREMITFRSARSDNTPSA